MDSFIYFLYQYNNTIADIIWGVGLVGAGTSLSFIHNIHFENWSKNYVKSDEKKVQFASFERTHIKSIVTLIDFIVVSILFYMAKSYHSKSYEIISSNASKCLENFSKEQIDIIVLAVFYFCILFCACILEIVLLPKLKFSFFYDLYKREH